MILKLQPEQISAMWEAIKFAAVGANGIGPDRSEEFLNTLLGNLLSGVAQAWVSFVDGEQGREIYAVGVTCIMTEPVLGMNYLLMHSLYGYKTLTLELMHEAMEALCAYAKGNDCHKFIAMTTDERLLKMYQHLGMHHEVYVYSKDL